MPLRVENRGVTTITQRIHHRPRSRKRRGLIPTYGRRAAKDLTDEVITATTARAEELFFELVDTLVTEDDPIGVACSLLVQLTRFVAEAGRTPKELSRRRDAAD